MMRIKHPDIKIRSSRFYFTGKFFISLAGTQVRMDDCGLSQWRWPFFQCLSFFSMIPRSATVPVIPPRLIISKCLILLARLRNTTAKLRSWNLWGSHQEFSYIITIPIIFWLEWVRISSCGLIPTQHGKLLLQHRFLYFWKILYRYLAQLFSRLLLLKCRTSLASSTADLSLVPLLINMAMSSESLRLSAPFLKHFFHGVYRFPTSFNGLWRACKIFHGIQIQVIN